MFICIDYHGRNRKNRPYRIRFSDLAIEVKMLVISWCVDDLIT